MTDSEFNGHIYKAISAITAKGKSPLHADTVVAQAWLDDDVNWRDVFKPKQAPNMPPYEFLVATANGTNPYWEDTDQTNKHWVFPGRPDLEEKANTRSLNLDSDEKDFEQATDLITQEVPRVTISNITEDKVGEYTDDASDIGKEVIAASAPATPAPVAETPAPVAETPAPTQPATPAPVASEPVAEAAPVDVADAPETVPTEPEGDAGSDYDDLPF